MVQPEPVAAVQFWHADIGALFKEIVNKKLQLWNWKDNAWQDCDQALVTNWMDRRWAGECDRISPERAEQFAPGASA